MSSASRESALQARADKLLIDNGIEGGWDAAPEELRILAEGAASALGGRTGTSAMGMFLEQVGRRVKPSKGKGDGSPYSDWKPESGDPCPLCGANRVTILTDADAADKIIEFLAREA